MSDHPLHEDEGRAGALIPEERVHAALRRAAQLQAEAAERLEMESRSRLQAQAGADSSGFRREHVEGAAVEVGISPEYIRQALLEQDALGEHATELAPWIDNLGNRMLGMRSRSIEISRTIATDPAAVLEAMQRIFPAHPYNMTLVDSIGGLPLEGGVLVFQLPRITMMTSSYTPFSNIATAVDLLQVHVSLRRVQLTSGAGCEVTLRGDLRTSTRRNVWTGLAASGIGGGVGGFMGAFFALVSGAILPVAAAGAVVGVAAVGAAGAKGYGALYRHSLKKMLRELEVLLKVVDTSARTGGGFRSPSPPGPTGTSGGMPFVPTPD